MTRQEIKNEYDVDKNGIIRSPGKFENEKLYAVYFYDAMLNGDSVCMYPCEQCECYGEDGCEADECHHKGYSVFDVTDEDRKEFPELKDAEQVFLEESDTGFIYCTTKP